MTSLKVVVVAAVVAASGAAHADFSSMGKFMTTLNGYQKSFATASYAYSEQQAKYAKAAGVSGAPATTPAPPVKHAPITATDFKPAVKGHPVVDQILAETVPNADDRVKAKAAVEQAFAVFEKNGVRRTNLANSVALVLELSMVATTGYQGDDAAQAELLATINDTLAASPAFKKMSAKDLQTTCDALWLSAALMVQFLQDGATDPKAKQAGQQLATTLLATLVGR